MAASGFRMNVEVEVFSAVVGLLVTLQCPSSGASQTAVAASVFRMNVEVEVFSAVVRLLTNGPRLRTVPPPHSYGNQRLQRQFDGLLMIGIVIPETIEQCLYDKAINFTIDCCI